MQFRFCVSKVTQYSPRLKMAEKVFFVEADTLGKAIEQVNDSHKGWDICSAWAVWPQPQP